MTTNPSTTESRLREKFTNFGGAELDLFLVPHIDRSHKCWMIENVTNDLLAFIENEKELVRREELKLPNELLRSAHEIAIREFKREGNKYTYWEGFINRLIEELFREGAIMYPKNNHHE